MIDQRTAALLSRAKSQQNATVHNQRPTSFYTTTCPSDNFGVVVAVTATIADLARIVAGMRTSTHNGVRSAVQDLGCERNREADRWGLTAEAAVVDALQRCGMSPRGWVAFSSSAPRGCDFTLDGSRIDIKAVCPRFRYVTINEEKHFKRLCDTYVIAHFLDESHLRLYAVPWENVSSWDRRDGHSPYRSVDVHTLEPVSDLADLGRAQR